MLQTGYMKRFNPGFREIKAAIPDLGEIESAEFKIFMSAPEPDHSPKAPAADMGKAADTGGAWYGDVKRSGGGAMTHNGSHHLDLLRYFLGDVQTLRCKTRYENAGDGEYFYHAVLTMEDGLDVNMKVGRVDIPKLGPEWKVFDGGWNESIEFVGTRGYIRVDNPTWQGYEPMTVTRWMQGMCGPETHHCECRDQWTREFETFIQNCERHMLSEDSSSVIDGYRVDVLIETMRESGRENGSQKVPFYKY